MNETIVITGASSGIGRETALRSAARGANLVLAARSEDALEAVANECRAMGVDVTVLLTDVTNEQDIEALLETVLDNYGALTAWINIAGVTELGSFTEVPAEDFRRVLEINLMGTVHGSRAALNQFIEQGQGTLINVSSVLGAVPTPYESSYVASKFAVRGFTASLRQEMQLANESEIHICTVLPATMSTPIYQNAANVYGKVAQPIPPVYQASMVAAAIDSLLDKPKAEVVVGKAGMDLMLLHKLLPALSEKIMARYIEKLHFLDKKQADTVGNLYEASKFPGKGSGQRPLPRFTDAAVMTVGLLGLAALGYRMYKRKS